MSYLLGQMQRVFVGHVLVFPSTRALASVEAALQCVFFRRGVGLRQRQQRWQQVTTRTAAGWLTLVAPLSARRPNNQTAWNEQYLLSVTCTSPISLLDVSSAVAMICTAKVLPESALVRTNTASLSDGSGSDLSVQSPVPCASRCRTVHCVTRLVSAEYSHITRKLFVVVHVGFSFTLVGPLGTGWNKKPQFLSHPKFPAVFTAWKTSILWLKTSCAKRASCIDCLFLQQFYPPVISAFK